ncbi:MAG: LemA family protein [Deltaproteobacteria bacterium]|jgi:LemA protein|uniref:LemA family protein n=1 Tax=Hydrosulfovibrio ferrireducens TaxID=2934181 RepID=UPI001227262E|nr:MAG: LemA family protein [Deltaproteobacteria bacterium]
MDFIWGIFKLFFWGGVILAGIALFSYNKLQRFSQDIKEKASNVQIAISKKLTLINQLIDVVKGFQESEQFTHLKISQDSTATNLMNAYQQSGTLLTSLQGMAEKFPNLKANEQYHRLVDSIQHCESDIQQCRKDYNSAVKEYNSTCLSIPTVFIARFIGFSSAPYLEFDISGVKDITSLKEFKTDDGERLQQLLASAGNQLAGATRNIANHAGQAGKLLSEKIKEKSTPKYFYMIPGGVPKGPLSFPDIQNLLYQQKIEGNVLVAEVESQDWRSIESVAAQQR